MPSSVMWAEQLRIFPPHRQRCQCLIYLFSSEPPQSLTLLSLISRTFRSISVLPASKASAFFLIQSVKKKKKKKGGNTKNFKVDLNIQIHTSWRRLRRRQKKKLPCLLHIYHQNSGADLRRIMWKKEELVWLKQGRNLKWEEKNVVPYSEQSY